MHFVVKYNSLIFVYNNCYLSLKDGEKQGKSNFNSVKLFLKELSTSANKLASPSAKVYLTEYVIIFMFIFIL